MAVSTFGVVYTDIYPRLPFDLSAIGPSTTPLSTADLTAYINDAGAQLAPLLTKAGVDPASLDDDATQQCANAIKAYATARALQTVGYSGALASAAMTEWEALIARYGNAARTISGRGSRVLTNATDSLLRPAPFFRGHGSKF